MNKLTFEPLNQTHFGKVHEWFNKLHVQAFYSLRPWTLEEVYKKLMPYLQGEKQIKCFIIYQGTHPFGYIQSYPIKENPWENQDLPEKIIKEAAGIDLFIGEEDYLGKGLGSEIISQFLEKHIWPFFRYCLADTDVRNKASLGLFYKCGFIEHKKIFFKNALNQQVFLQLFIKERPFES